MGTLEIIKTNSHEEASLTLLKLLSNEFVSKENYSIGLSGGNTPKFLYKELAIKYGQLNNITLWTVDDRHVDIRNELSNQAMINDIFSKTNFKILSLKHFEDPKESASNYTKLVFENINYFNSAVLGVGDDGHIASLFSNTNALNISEKCFIENEVNILTRWRVTSTFSLLSSIENIYLLVTGENKKNILQEMKHNEELPINKLIEMREKTTLLTDQII